MDLFLHNKYFNNRQFDVKQFDVKHSELKTYCFELYQEYHTMNFSDIYNKKA